MTRRAAATPPPHEIESARSSRPTRLSGIRYMKQARLLLLVLLFATPVAFAGVDKVYGPLVEPGEIELEMRGYVVADGDEARDGEQKTKVGLGYGIASRLFVEAYLEFEKPANGDYELEAYELEAKLQLGEQGQYFADFGLLTELEKERGGDAWEFKIGPLMQKPFGNWMGTLNLLGETKFGSAVAASGHWEFLRRAQLKYLSSPRFEPGLEYYGDADTQALGPAVYGRIDLERTKILWQAGWLIGLDSATADNTLRWQFEWEF
jgi:hypothetical protein